MSAAAEIAHERTIDFLRLNYPSAKHAARDLNASVSTAEGWFQGKPMSRRHWWALLERFGWQALERIAKPALDKPRDLAAEIAALKAGLTAIEQQLREGRT